MVTEPSPQSSPLWGTGTQVLLVWWWWSTAPCVWIIAALSPRPGANGITFEQCYRHSYWISYPASDWQWRIEWSVRNTAATLWNLLSIRSRQNKTLEAQKNKWIKWQGYLKQSWWKCRIHQTNPQVCFSGFSVFLWLLPSRNPPPSPGRLQVPWGTQTKTWSGLENTFLGDGCRFESQDASETPQHF